MVAVYIAGHLGAGDVPSVTVTHTTGVFVVTELSAVGIFFTLKHAACKRTILRNKH